MKKYSVGQQRGPEAIGTKVVINVLALTIADNLAAIVQERHQPRHSHR